MASRLSDLEMDDCDTVTTWLTAFKAMARSKGWKDENEKYEITDNFISLCGLRALHKLISVVQPDKIEEMSFENLEKKILSFIKPKTKLIIAERAKFYCLHQFANEKITEFLARLRKGSMFCEFDKLKNVNSPHEEMIKLALIAGLSNSEIKSRILELMQTVDLKIDEIIEKVQQIESVNEFTQTNDLTQSEKLNFDINFIKNNKKPTNCEICGYSNHSKQYCRFKNVRCHNCKQLGHYASRCKQKRLFNNRSNHVHENLKSTKIIEDEFELDSSNNFVDIFSVNDNNISNVFLYQFLIDNNVSKLLMQKDTGSSCNIISSKMWNTLNRPALKKYKGGRLRTYDNHELKVFGEFEVILIDSEKYIPIILKVVRSDKNFGLIGKETVDLLVNSIEINEQLKEKNECNLGVIKNEKAKLELMEETKPIFCSARAIPLPLVDLVDKELDRMKDLGIIEEIPEGGSAWASPLVCSRKPNGSIRLCCDYKVTINNALKMDSYHPPDMETLFSRIHEAKCFAKFDLRSAYWQVELDEHSKDLTTINTTKGLFRFRRLPFGVKTASAIFQRIIEKVCSGLKGIVVYQDDILVFGKDRTELNERSQKLLERLNKRNVQINWEKSIRFAESMSFLGHTISADGIKPDKRLVDKVLKISRPKTKKELNSFLGLVNFYSKLVPQFANICQPLHRVRKNSVPFYWGKEQDNAFRDLKEILSSDLVVVPYDLRKEATITCDASDKAISGILSQEDKPVMYFSRVLTANEMRYSVIEKEALALIWMIKRSEKFLLGRHFTIKTDHRALQYIFNSQAELPKHASNRLQRWAIFLSGFDYSIHYVEGSSIPHVDALNRMNYEESITDKHSICFEGVHWGEISNISWTDLVKETNCDKVLRKIQDRITNEDWVDCSKAEMRYKRYHNYLSNENGVVLLGSRPIIPYVLRNRCIEKAHESHFGMNITKEELKKNVWWPGMDRDVEEYIRQCAKCSRKPKSVVEKIEHKWEKEKLPFERVHMDWAAIKGVGEILILVDAMSGWPEAFLCRNRESDTVKNILQSVFARFGVPRELVSDNAKEFISNDLLRWLANVGCQKTHTPHYHPSSNGLVERMVQTLKRAIKIYDLDKGNFNNFLQKVLLTYRGSRICRQRSATPAALVFGREIRSPLINFNGNSYVYHKNDSSEAENCEILVQNSQRTVYVDCGGNIRLAHFDQLRAAQEEENEEQSGSLENDHSSEEQSGSSSEVRYPSRVRRPPGWHKNYDLK